MSAHQRKRIAELLTNLLRDLAEIGAAVGGTELDFKLNVDTVGKLEEEFTVARLHISKMKSEVKNIVQRCHSLESANIDANQKVVFFYQSLILSDVYLLNTDGDQRTISHAFCVMFLSCNSLPKHVQLESFVDYVFINNIYLNLITDRRTRTTPWRVPASDLTT